MNVCWTKRRPENRMLQLLVCRLQLGIDNDKTVRLILRMLRPKLKQLATWVSRRVKYRQVEALADLESRTIELLMYSYKLGEVVPPEVWLFNSRYGGVRHWAKKIVEREYSYQNRHLSYDHHAPTSIPQRGPDDLETRIQDLNRRVTDHRVQTFTLTQDRYDAELDSLVEHAQRVIEDGRTLSTAEYRVLRFHLLHARRGSGHRWLSKKMGIARQDVTTLRRIALEKVARAVRARPPRQETVEELVNRSAAEAAAVLGVSMRWVYRLRQRYREQPS